MSDVNDEIHRKLEELLDIASPEEIIKLVNADATPPPKRGVKGTKGRPPLNQPAREQIACRCVALDAWATHLQAILADNVVSLESAKKKA